MRMPLERPFDGAAWHCVGGRRNAASRLPAPNVTPLFQSGTSASHSETSVTSPLGDARACTDQQRGPFRTAKVAEEDGAEPQANRNPGGGKFDAGVHRRDHR